MASSKSALATMRQLPPRYFEQFVADVWQERQGWTTEVSDAGADGGIDVLGRPPNGGPLTAVQCKRYAAGMTVSSDKVQQYAALRQQHDRIEGVTIVTTGSFTRPAEEAADALDVKCLDGTDLDRLVSRYDASEILEWYAAGKPRGGV